MPDSYQPLISIIIPSYNRADIIAETLSSVKQQTYPHWECLVVDDHSTDATHEIVTEFCQQEKRFTYRVNEITKGAQGSRNTGLQHAKGDFLLFLDSDDILTASCLTQRISVAAENRGYDFYCFPTGVFKKQLYDSNLVWNILNKEANDLFRFVSGDMPWHTSGVLWKASTQKKLAGWDEALLCGQDWDMHLRSLLLPFVNYFKVPDEALYIDTYYRDDADRVSIARKDTHPLHLQNKWYLTKKTIPAIKGLRNKSQKIELARMIYRLTLQSISVLGFDKSIQNFRTSMNDLGINPFFTWIWSGYLYNLHHMPQNKGLRRFFNLAYRLSKHRDLRTARSSHMAAVLNNVVKKNEEIIPS